MSDFCERLKEVRLQKKLTQEQFAQICDVTKNSQQNYESGKRSPDAVYLMRLVAAGYDVKYLLTGERDRSELTAAQRELLDFYDSANLEYQQAAFDLFMIEQSPESEREKLRYKQNLLELLTGSRQQNGLTQEQTELLELWQNAPLLVRNAALNALMTRDGATAPQQSKFSDISQSSSGTQNIGDNNDNRQVNTKLNQQAEKIQNNDFRKSKIKNFNQ